MKKLMKVGNEISKQVITKVLAYPNKKKRNQQQQQQKKAKQLQLTEMQIDIRCKQRNLWPSLIDINT